MPIGYIILIKKLRETGEIGKIIEKHKNDVIKTTSVKNGHLWTTAFIISELNDFPRGSLYSFNPLLRVNEDFSQVSLSKFSIGGLKNG